MGKNKKIRNSKRNTELKKLKEARRAKMRKNKLKSGQMKKKVILREEAKKEASKQAELQAKKK